jgi:hypothetical protein
MQKITKREIHEFHSRFNVLGAVRGKRSPVANLWIFNSPKIDKRFAVRSDLDFAHFIFLEANTAVDRYIPYPPEQLSCRNEKVEAFSPSAQVFLRNGDHEWWVFKERFDARQPDELEPHDFHVDGRRIVICNRNDFKGREIEFDNWLVLCASINRNQIYAKHLESLHLSERAKSCEFMVLGELLNEESLDPALTLAAVAALLQDGHVAAELVKKLLSTNTKLYWRR